MKLSILLALVFASCGAISIHDRMVAESIEVSSIDSDLFSRDIETGTLASWVALCDCFPSFQWKSLSGLFLSFLAHFKNVEKLLLHTLHLDLPPPIR